MRRGERGSATVLAVGLMAVLMCVGVVLLAIGQLAAIAEQVRAGADLAALAGAQSTGDACSRADELARANGLTLVDCAVDGTDVVATVQAQPPTFVQRVARLLGAEPSALRGSARAGQQPVEQAHGP